MQAGNFILTPSYGYSAAELFANEDPAAIRYIRDFSHHNYPQTVSGAGGDPGTQFDDADEPRQHREQRRGLLSRHSSNSGRGLDYVFGETNSGTQLYLIINVPTNKGLVSGGGSPEISKTFGAALWVLDYSLRATSKNISRLHFHQGDNTTSFYVWWSLDLVNSPYYGGYVATAALAGASYAAALDDGTTNYASYVFYDAKLKPLRAVCINTDYFDGTGVRGEHTFTISGLGPAQSVTAKRLTAASALSRQDYGDAVTFGGQSFADKTMPDRGQGRD